MSRVPHDLALRTPWYVLERLLLPATDPLARRPGLQKYDRVEFVEDMMADPRRSLRFDPVEDVWAFPVPLGAFRSGATGRSRFATSRMVTTGMRKLYQPSHDRFYAVTIEAFCDQPGLPRPGETDGVELRYVVRRERVVIDGDRTAARTLARDLAQQLDREANAKDPAMPVPDTDDVDDVLFVERTQGRPLSAAQAALLAQARPRRVVEAWSLDAAGRGRWVPVQDLPELAPGEQENPMWQLPAPDEGCAPSPPRSLWFGTVPAFSAELDVVTSRPKLDDRSIYRIRCFARRRPARGHEHCPPALYWSDPTQAYRLASFYDPDGTKNRLVSITMPDFRTLAARSGRAPVRGGVEIVRPPGSQLSFQANNDGSISSPSQEFGSQTSRCFFAIELLMIVAMFVFSLFLPIIMFLFQLWWMLLLRFCFPRADLALSVLGTFFSTGAGTLATLPPAGQDLLDDLLETKGGTARLKNLPSTPAHPNPFADRATMLDLVKGMDPDAATALTGGTPETLPDDPLCHRP